MSGQSALELDDLTSPKIYEIREEKVVLDRDVARLFGVSTSVFNQQVKRNKAKFGDDMASIASLISLTCLRAIASHVSSSSSKSSIASSSKRDRTLPEASRRVEGLGAVT